MSGGADAFEAALEKSGIDVDSTLKMPPGLSVMYEYEEEKETEHIATVALLYAKVPQIAETLSVTPIQTSGQQDERVANYSVTRNLANDYNADELSKAEYVDAVRDTWTPFEGGA